MFDFDAGKFLIIGVVALIVIGPKELPRVLRQVGQAVARVRRMAGEFQGQFMDAMKEADLDTIRQDLKKIGADADAQFKVNFDPARDIQRELSTSLEAPATASRVPALAEATAVPTDGFALPEPLAGDTTNFAAEGIAPVVDSGDEAPVYHPEIALGRAETAVPNGATAEPHSPGAKRIIRVQKRPRLAVARVHPVLDRTAVTRGRAGRAMGEELAER